MILVLFFVVWSIPLATTYTLCTNTDYAGVSNPATRNDGYKSNTGWGYVNRLSAFTFSCCGVISQWEINVKDAGAIEMQVWRTSGSQEQLVGENTLSATVGYTCCPTGGGDSDDSDESPVCVSCPLENELQFNINTAEQITVIPGDAIGWRTAGVEVLTYDSTWTSSNKIYHDTSMPDVLVGGTHSFPQNSINYRMYAVRAYLAPGSAPTLTNLQTSVTIPNTLTPGEIVFTPTFTDNNAYDTHTFTHSGTMPSYFAIDVNTGIVTVAQALLAGTFTVNLVVADICGLQDTQQINIAVYVTNKAPIFEPMIGTAIIHEDTVTETLLNNITVTDNDMVNCTITDTVPANAPFMIQEHNTTSEEINSTIYYKHEFGIYLTSGASLSYSDQTTYELNITCNDNELWSSYAVTVYVQQNAPPAFSNLPGHTTISARNSSVGEAVYIVNGTDVDNIILTFNMTCNESTCPFSLTTGGVLSISYNLLHASFTTYGILVYISDGNHLVGPDILSVFIIDRNNPPMISGVPSTYFLSEHSSAMTTFLTLSISDVDIMDNVSCSIEVWPIQGYQIFDFNATSHELFTKSGAVLDYETITYKTFNVTFTATDYIDSVSESLVIYIQDENEPPKCLSSISYVWINESQAGTFISGPPSYIDPDTGDTVIYKIQNGTGVGYVQINQATGLLSFLMNYDVDQDHMPTSIDLHIEIEDSGGLSDVCKIDIHVLNINDNAPTFNAISYTFTASTDTPAGTPIGIVYVTDADDVNGSSITYTTDQASAYGGDFILTNYGEIITLIPFSNFTAGQLLMFGVTAFDNGSPQQSANVNITIVIVKSNSTSPELMLASATETGNSPGTDDTTSLLIILIILVACVFILLITALSCQILRIRRLKNRTENSNNQGGKKTSPKPKPLPPLHRMTSTTLLLNETGFIKSGADGNKHLPLRRALSDKHFSQNLLCSSQSKVSALSHVKENNSMPRILEKSGVSESHLQGFMRDRTALRF